MKYESNTPMYSKDIARKPFFVRTGQDVSTYVRTDKGDAISPPITNGGGIINMQVMVLVRDTSSECALQMYEVLLKYL